LPLSYASTPREPVKRTSLARSMSVQNFNVQVNKDGFGPSSITRYQGSKTPRDKRFVRAQADKFELFFATLSKLVDSTLERWKLRRAQKEKEAKSSSSPVSPYSPLNRPVDVPLSPDQPITSQMTPPLSSLPSSPDKEVPDIIRERNVKFKLRIEVDNFYEPELPHLLMPPLDPEDDMAVAQDPVRAWISTPLARSPTPGRRTGLYSKSNEEREAQVGSVFFSTRASSLPLS